MAGRDSVEFPFLKSRARKEQGIGKPRGGRYDASGRDWPKPEMPVISCRGHLPWPHPFHNGPRTASSDKAGCRLPLEQMKYRLSNHLPESCRILRVVRVVAAAAGSEGPRVLTALVRGEHGCAQYGVRSRFVASFQVTTEYSVLYRNQKPVCTQRDGVQERASGGLQS